MDKDLSGLIEYLDNKFQNVDNQFAEMRNNFSGLANGVDTYAKKADTYFQEMVMLGHKVDRHEKRIQLLAEKAGIKLEYV